MTAVARIAILVVVVLLMLLLNARMNLCLREADFILKSHTSKCLNDLFLSPHHSYSSNFIFNETSDTLDMITMHGNEMSQS